MRLRTILLLTLMIVSGVGTGVVARFDDGMYSAILFFMFPIFSALMFLFIVSDIANPSQAAPRARQHVLPATERPVLSGGARLTAVRQQRTA